MRVHQKRSGFIIPVDGDVDKIEVENIVLPDEDSDDLVPTFSRTIRITGTGRDEVIEIFCTATSEEAVHLKKVAELAAERKA